jgi:hypothetical protein
VAPARQRRGLGVEEGVATCQWRPS